MPPRDTFAAFCNGHCTVRNCRLELEVNGCALTLLGVQELVDDNVVCVNLVLCEFLDQALGLVERQELGDADTDKGSEVGVLELRVDLGDDFTHLLELGKHVLLRGSSAEHGLHLCCQLM